MKQTETEDQAVLAALVAKIEQRREPSDRTLLWELLESSKIEAPEVAVFTRTTRGNVSQWRSGVRKMPFHVALSLVWLAKHCLESGEKKAGTQEQGQRILLFAQQLGTVPNDSTLPDGWVATIKALHENTRRLLDLMLERVASWSEREYQKAKAYCAARGGNFDLKPRDITVRFADEPGPTSKESKVLSKNQAKRERQKARK